MSSTSTTHFVLIPSYNPGAKVLATVQAARAQWTPVWVVVDGSTDGSWRTVAGAGAHRSRLARHRAAGKPRQG
jgi:glycosyltransferase involved in cell wall biosynthesis